MVLFEKLPEKYVLGFYYSKYYCDGEYRYDNDFNFNEYSQRILDLKDNKSSDALDYFEVILNKIIEDEEDTSLVVPPTDSGTKLLVQRIARSKPNISDATDIWINRLKTINDQRIMLVKNKNVILIDDVVRTGDTMRTCKSALLGAKAKWVKCITLGKNISGSQGKEEAYDTINNYPHLNKMKKLREIEFAKDIYKLFFEGIQNCKSENYKCISQVLEKIEEEKQQFKGKCDCDFDDSIMGYEEAERVIHGDDTFSYNNDFQSCFHWSSSF
jgi:hypoxanthine phosphoribosyltransferase